MDLLPVLITAAIVSILWFTYIKFSQKNLRIRDFENRPIWIFFFQKNKKNFCLIPMKISHKLCARMDGLQSNM